MKASKIQIGATVISSKFGTGVITEIITKSTGYVKVDFNGNVRKEMAYNLKDENGESMKAKPSVKPLTSGGERRYQEFKNGLYAAIRAEHKF